LYDVAPHREPARSPRPLRIFSTFLAGSLDEIAEVAGNARGITDREPL
jgi:hypothetical protein